MILLLLKVAVFLILLVVVLLYYKHTNLMRRAKFYEDQGCHKLEGFDSAPLGNVKLILDYENKKKAIEKTDQMPLKPPLLWILDEG